MEENKVEIGTIKIADEVIQLIAGITLGEIKGISTAGGSSITDMFTGKKSAAKGVKVDVKDDQVVVDLKITVDYGACIPNVAWEIQEKVKNDIETMTNLNVSKVNIFIEGVNIDKVIKKEDAKPIQEALEADLLNEEEVQNKN